MYTKPDVLRNNNRVMASPIPKEYFPGLRHYDRFTTGATKVVPSFYEGAIMSCDVVETFGNLIGAILYSGTVTADRSRIR